MASALVLGAPVTDNIAGLRCPLELAKRCLLPLWQTDQELSEAVDNLKREIEGVLPKNLADLYGAFYNAYCAELSKACKEISK